MRVFQIISLLWCTGLDVDQSPQIWESKIHDFESDLSPQQNNYLHKTSPEEIATNSRSQYAQELLGNCILVSYEDFAEVNMEESAVSAAA